MAKTINTILSLKDKMSSPLMKVSKNVDKVTREMKKSQNQINKWGKNAVKSIDNVVKRTAKIGLAFGALAGGMAIKSGFSEAMDLEGFKVQLETATKDAKKAGEIMAWTIDLANKTPFEAAPLVEGASKLEMMGMSAKKWLPLLGDMAAATNKPVDQAVEAMIDAQTGELERMKEFGITKTMISKKAGEMFRNQEVVNAKGQIVDQEKFNEAMVSIMTDRYKGGMDKLSNTTKGLWSTITGVTKSGLATIVGMQKDGTIKQGSMLAMLKEKIKSIANIFDKWQKDGTINKIANNVTNAVTKMINFFKSLFNFVKRYEKVITTLVLVVATMYSVIKVITALKVALGALNTIWLVLNGTLAITPLGWIILAISAVVAAGYLLYRNWDMIKSKLGELGQAIWDFGGKQIMFLVNALKQFGLVIWDIIMRIVESIKPLLPTFVTVFTQIAKVVGFLIVALAPILGFIAGVFVIKIVYGFLLIANQVTAVVTTIAGVLNGLLTILSGVINFVVGVFTGNWSMAWSGVQSVISGVIGVISSLWQGLVGLLTAPVDAVVNLLDAVFKEKVEGIKRLWNSLKNFLKNPIKGVVNLFKRESGGGVDGSHKTGLPRVPWDGYIAELHKGETVLTKDESDDYHGGNRKSVVKTSNNTNNTRNSQPINVYIQGNVVGNKQFANEVGNEVYAKVKLALDNI